MKAIILFVLRIFVVFCVVLTLSACVGSPVRIANSAGSKPVKIGGEVIYVLLQDGVWSATFEDYNAKFIYVDPIGQINRKAKLTSAIQQITGCRVTDSYVDPMSITMHANVSCDPKAPQNTLKLNDSTGNKNIRILESNIPVDRLARLGKFSFEAERLAKINGCSQTPKADLTWKGPGAEIFSVSCSNGDVLSIRCDFGNCRSLK